jgi:hypothetical protein
LNLCAFWPDFSRYWVGSWSVISLACCTFTLLSFLIDVSRFAYPERPIIYLGACFAMIAVALVVGFAVGDDIACDDEAGREVMSSQSDNNVVTFVWPPVHHQGMELEACSKILSLRRIL